MGAEPRRIVVVGGGTGRAAPPAPHFHNRGEHVVAVDIKPNDTPAARHVRCDLRDPADIAGTLDEIGTGWDLLAHVAGVPGTAAAADVLKINYLGMRLITEGMLPRLRQGGAVVAVASTAAVGWEQRTETLAGLLDATDADAVERWQAEQDPAYPVYSSSKQAVILYAKRLAGPAWTKYGVRINTVSPGPVETPILPDFERTMGKDILDMVRATVGRHATVDDVVPVIDFLGSPAARWITGQDIHVDAGYITSLTCGIPIEL